MDKIKMLDGECWWGGKVPSGCDMPFDENSDCTFDIESRDGENDQSASLFLSSGGRYIWNDNPFAIKFNKGEISLECAYGTDFEIGEGYKNLKGAYLAAAKKHFSFNGELPDKLFFTSPQYNTWMELGTDQTTENILNYARGILENGLPAGVLMIDGGWQEDYGVLEFHKGKIPDPAYLIYELHKLGFKVMLWTSPIVSSAGVRFKYLRSKGYLLKDKDGEIAVRRWWSGFSAMLDFTNPDAVKWFRGQLDSLVECYGVDGYKFDAGDASIYCRDDDAYVKTAPRNHTTAFNIMGEKYKFNEFRAAHNSGGRPIVARLHDKNHSWDNIGLNTLIPNTTVQSLLGYAYCCPDMVGGGMIGSVNSANDTDGELFIRWSQANALMPMMQISLAPWRVLSSENYEIVKKSICLHKEYGEHIYALAQNSAKTGEPIFRNMEYEFPNEGFEHVCDQFMLGSDIMSAPVLTKGAAKRSVKFPKGEWADKEGNIVSHGGETKEFDAPIDTLLYFKKVK